MSLTPTGRRVDLARIRNFNGKATSVTQGDHPTGVAERTSTIRLDALGYPELPPLEIVRGPRDTGAPPPPEAARPPLRGEPKGPIVLTEGAKHRELMRRIEARRGKQGRAEAFKQIARINWAIDRHGAAATDEERAEAIDIARWCYRNLVWLDSEPPTDEEVARGCDASKPFTDALSAVATEAATKRTPPAPRSFRARPRTARRQHSTTRTLVAAAGAASGESGSPPSGGTQASSPASSTDEPQPPGRIRHQYEWVLAGVSTAPAGSFFAYRGEAA